MSRPRVFVSSTYYDLKHLRSSIDNFIESLGFDSILSEKGDIAYSPYQPLDKSCYKAAETCDIFVLIVGGRYGSRASTAKEAPTDLDLERYDSVTKLEYEAAASRNIPIYILIEQNVYAEYHTYIKNKGNRVDYAHVDSVNIFELIEGILAKTRNNPICTFERFTEVENWLREQWAGRFQDLLLQKNNQKQLSTLSAQIATLSDQVEALSVISSTLKTYLEVVVTKVSPDEAPDLIESERIRKTDSEKTDIRRTDFENTEELRKNMFFRNVVEPVCSVEEFENALNEAKSYKDFADIIISKNNNLELKEKILANADNIELKKSINKARELLEREKFA